MLRTLRDTQNGGPALRMRVMAVLVILGMLALSAPVLIPVSRWLLGSLW